MHALNNNTERDAQLLAVGRQCSAASCFLVDFLPFKCEHCSESFCAEHFTVAAHKCPKYDERKHDRVAPSCPLCNTPVAIPPGEDPNIRMERHISSECNVMTGRSGRHKSTPVCARGKCGKVLFAPINCDTCHKQYCPQHRFPKDHGCETTVPSVVSSPARRNVWKASVPKSTGSTPLMPSKTSSFRATSSAPESSPSPEVASSKATLSITNPFSRVDRRARAEKGSRRKGMIERAKKGLLTEQEKLILAEEEAERARKAGSSSDKECTIM
ncbi:hypothetical protein ID866_1449 [Astraeus odoratus]|nr:hypothetical protein ID866_1449 [Astraeus odoratus]